MYDPQELVNLNRQFKKFSWIFVATAVIGLGIIIPLIIFRLQTPAIAVGCVWGASLLFLWGMFLQRIIKRRIFVRDALNARNNYREGVLASIDDKIIIREGVEFISLRIFINQQEADDNGGWLAYYDAERLPLPVSVGEKIRYCVYSNYIKSIEPLEG